MRPPGARREALILAAILGAGALLRLAYLLELPAEPGFDAPRFEAQYHHYWARALATGDWTPPPGVTDPEIRTTPYFRPPGYPTFLASVYALFGTGPWAPRIVQAMLGLGTALLAWALARRAFGPAAGLGAAALAASAWTFLFFEGELLAPGLLVPLLLAALLAVSGWREGLTWGRAAAAGLLVGLAALVRPNALVLAPVALVWAAWLARRRRRSAGDPEAGSGAWRTWAVSGLVFLATLVLAVTPAAVRNALVAGELVPITSNAGINLFIGTHPESDGITPGAAELGELTGLAGWESFDYPRIVEGMENRLGRELGHAEVSRIFARRALENLAEHPWRAVQLAGRKLLLFFGPAEVTNNEVLEVTREHSRTLRRLPGFAALLALALAALALFGWHRVRGGEDAGDAKSDAALEITVLLLLFLGAYTASFLPFFVASRFRLPLAAVLTVFGGDALGRLGRDLSARRWRPFAAGVALVLAARALTGVAWVPYEPDRALWHWRRALLYREKGELEEAIEEVRTTLREAPHHAEAGFLLAETLAASGRSEEAIAAYRRLLGIDPEAIAAHNNLARLLAGRGELAAAAEHWRRVLELAPERLSALHNLALLLATAPDPELRDPPRALELAERACELTGCEDPAVRRTLEVARRAVEASAAAAEEGQ